MCCFWAGFLFLAVLHFPWRKTQAKTKTPSERKMITKSKERDGKWNRKNTQKSERLCIYSWHENYRLNECNEVVELYFFVSFFLAFNYFFSITKKKKLEKYRIYFRNCKYKYTLESFFCGLCFHSHIFIHFEYWPNDLNAFISGNGLPVNEEVLIETWVTLQNVSN